MASGIGSAGLLVQSTSQLVGDGEETGRLAASCSLIARSKGSFTATAMGFFEATDRGDRRPVGAQSLFVVQGLASGSWRQHFGSHGRARSSSVALALRREFALDHQGIRTVDAHLHREPQLRVWPDAPRGARPHLGRFPARGRRYHAQRIFGLPPTSRSALDVRPHS